MNPANINKFLYIIDITLYLHIIGLLNHEINYYKLEIVYAIDQLIRFIYALREIHFVLI